MDRFFEIVKKYPLWIFGGVVVFVLIFWYAGRDTGGASASQIVSLAPDPESVRANASVQIAQMTYNRDAQRDQAAIELAKIAAGASDSADARANETARALATTQAGAYMFGLSTSKEITETNANAAVAIAGKQADTAVTITGINARTADVIARVEANRDVLLQTSIQKMDEVRQMTRAVIAQQAPLLAPPSAAPVWEWGLDSNTGGGGM